MDAFAKVPIDSLTLAEAADIVEDPSWWTDTMPIVLFHYSVGDYWALTVGDHRRLIEFLQREGLVKDGDQPET